MSTFFDSLLPRADTRGKDEQLQRAAFGQLEFGVGVPGLLQGVFGDQLGVPAVHVRCRQAKDGGADLA